MLLGTAAAAGATQRQMLRPEWPQGRKSDFAMAQSGAALTGGAPLDVTLTGTAQSITGSDDETGTVCLKAMAPGESRMDLALSASTRSEIRTIDTNGNLVGIWSGSDGEQHSISYQNLWTDSSWFFPALTLTRVVNNTAEVATYIGRETSNPYCTSLSPTRLPFRPQMLPSCSTRSVLYSAFATRCSNPDFTAPHQGISLPGV